MACVSTPRRWFARTALAPLALMVVGPSALAQPAHSDWPTRQIRFIVPYPPGGPLDIVGRAMALVLSDALGKPVVVDNRAGASGILGTDLTAKAPADGYTILLASSANTIHPSLYPKLPYDFKRDLLAVGGIASAPLILVTHPETPVRNLQEFVSFVRSSAAPVSYGSPGTGSPNHLSAELMASRLDLKLTHVPYKGGAPAETDLIGGQITFMFNTIPSAVPHIANGRLRALAVTSLERSPTLPEVPTMAESGLPGYQTITWYGIVAPTGTPAEIVTRLNAEINRAWNNPNFVGRMSSLGLQPMPGSPRQFSDLFDSEMKKWAEVVKTAGVRVD